jgi:hypothetical protein
MTSYILAYRGGKKFADESANVAHRARWGAWMRGLGEAMINPGTPLANAKTVSASGVSGGDPNALTGYSIVRAESLDAALEIAKTCPFLEIGTIEVAMLMEMPR